MRRVLFVAALTAAIATAGTTASAQTPAQDSVSGTTTTPGFCCPSYEIQAFSGPSGENPTGLFRLFAFRGGSIDTSVTCLFVTGNRAIASVQLGLFYAEDNDGAGSDRYAFALTFPEPAPSCVREFPPDSTLQTVAQGGDLEVVDAQPLPTSKDQCKNGGWRNFPGFKNEGDCVSFVAIGGKHAPAGSL
jgi:hypothetical protein